MPLPEELTLTSDADYGLLGLRPEAVASVPIATRDALRLAAQDRVLSALGKRAKRPVTYIDGELRRAVMVFASLNAIRVRGARPNGEDERILASAVTEVETWLARVRLGEEEPYYVDASPALREMGPIAGSTRLSDEKMRMGYTGDPLKRGRCGCR